jgi:hypothetical protein
MVSEHQELMALLQVVAQGDLLQIRLPDFSTLLFSSALFEPDFRDNKATTMAQSQ